MLTLYSTGFSSENCRTISFGELSREPSVHERALQTAIVAVCPKIQETITRFEIHFQITLDFPPRWREVAGVRGQSP